MFKGPSRSIPTTSKNFASFTQSAGKEPCSAICPLQFAQETVFQDITNTSPTLDNTEVPKNLGSCNTVHLMKMLYESLSENAYIM
ncbi:hypothetical protein CDAR_318451 [Caerostris darwini]|uniref:Uncharacterized protein n=1 Tax=Caerostris darwini TaxID=1538125 RepID=A0AAV4R3C5_9ARAC|nr:hypothetical protein CDAR_318451 [Caerostris darwini]